MKNTTSIKENELFQKVMNKGTWYGGDFLSVFILKNGLEQNKIGLAIGKKVGKAYQRNKVKRYIRQAYSVLEQEMTYGYSIVFVWKSKAEYDNVDYDAIYKDVSKTLKKAGILN